jgi:nucleotide-binding universal stress UspA family protein
MSGLKKVYIHNHQIYQEDSMYKSIFIPLSSNGDQLPALRFGAALAEAFDAGAECAFTSKSLLLLEGEQRDKVSEILRKEGYTASQNLVDKFYQEQFAKRAEQVQHWFELSKEKLASGSRLQWREWLDFFDVTAEQIRDECSFHDLTIASYDLSTSILDDVVTGALFATGRPLVLMHALPEGKDLSECTVVLAWKFTPQTLRAQWFSLPILKKVGKVLIANVDEGEETSSAKELAELTTYLKRHGINAHSHTISNVKSPAAALEQYYVEQKADLMVMGAYSHSRLREMVLGGFTRHFLNSRKCNLLLAH